jgi:putative ABC transport system permease protein
MIKHNLLLIFRNFKRFKSTFLINLVGLSTGLACTLIIYLWVNDELKFDKFHKNDQQLYLVMANFHNSGNVVTTRATPGLLGDALEKEIAGVDYAVSTSDGIRTFTLSQGETYVKGDGLFASKNFFRAYSYDLVQGDVNKVMEDRNSIVISESLTRKIFGTTENILGKSMEWQIFTFKAQVTISGIMKDVPSNSSDQFDFVLSFEKFEKEIITYPNWNNNYAVTTVVLKEGTDVKEFNKKIEDFLKTKQADTNIKFFLQRFSETYLNSHYEAGVVAGGRISYVILFSIIAVFILFIACINFMNLSTAKASRRIKEVGIKKAVGAHRHTLIVQYMGESMLMSFSALLIAVLVVDLLLPQFNLITQKHLVLQFDTTVVLSFTAIAFVTGLIAGSYPALYLSGFSPAAVLKGKLSTSTGELWARKGLVVFQFSLSVIFIVCVLVIYKQIEFVQTRNLGYDRDNILYFEKEGKLNQNLDGFLTEIKKLSGVKLASATNYQVGSGGFTYGVDWEGKKETDVIQFREVTATFDLIELLDVKMKEGRSFSRDFISDSTGVVFNEAAIEAMRLKDPIGKTVNHYTGPKKIIGVVKDFHFLSLYEPVRPLFFLMNKDWLTYIVVKIEAGKEKQTADAIRELYQKYNPGFTFDYKFMDEDYQAMYAAEHRVATLSKYFAGLAIVISCLGLFGLAAFTAERRLKEIGIRKILGSTNANIIVLLSGDFMKMVIVSIIIALPVSYFMARYWLNSFAFRIDLEAWYFIAAGLTALIISWLTVGLQTIKASRVNPTQCLRDE